MLPGLRFLFVAIVLSVSMMIFGLGAAALLRSAQQEVASLPTRHVQPETIFAQQTEATTPTLAMLSVDARVPQQNGIDQPAVADAPPQVQPSKNASIEPNQVAAEADRSTAPTAALPPEEKSGSSDKAPGQLVRTETSAGIEASAPLPEKPEPEAQKHETPAADNPVPAAPAAVATTAAPAEMTPAPMAATVAPVETTSAPVGTTVAPVGTTAAAPATTAPETTAAVPATAAAVPAAAAPASVIAPSDDGAKSAAAKIATLGTLVAPVEPQAASKSAVSTASKRAQARRVVRRHRIARARLVLQKPAGQPAAAQPGPAPFFMTGQPGN